MQTESRMGWGLEEVGGGHGELVLLGDRVSFWEEVVLEVNGGDGCTAMWMDLMPLNSASTSS